MKSKNTKKYLKRYFGFESFMEKQEEIVKDALKSIDQFILLPTGSGKSICYQLPALLQKGVTIVVSPLKSLIKDQISNLQKKNIPVYGFYGNSTIKEKRLVLSEMIKEDSDVHIIYTTPETLASNEDFRNNLDTLEKKDKLTRFVIDEAHCISLWGNDFRPNYKELQDIRKDYPKVPIMALTATATNQVLKDSLYLLDINDARVYTKSYYRSNLNIVVKQRDKSSFIEIMNLVRTTFKDQSGIIYCVSRKKCEEISSKLNEFDIESRPYHAGLTDKVRNSVQENWQNGTYNVIVATIAFGMGIDKPDVRYVIHYNLPSSIENYYQEIGRAGRDGLQSECIMYYSYQDKIISESLIRRNTDTHKNEMYIEHQLSKLNNIVNYADNIVDCRHCQISNHLGELRPYDKMSCEKSCDNCKSKDRLVKKDVSDICQLLFRCIMELNNPTKANIKRQFFGSPKLHNLLKNYKSKKEIVEMFERIFMHLVVNKYLNETLKRNIYGYWTEKYQLYQKCKNVIIGAEDVQIAFRSPYVL